MQRLCSSGLTHRGEIREEQPLSDSASASARAGVHDPKVIHATLEELVGRARRLCGAGQRRILGITGTPGAGKSTLCAALLDALSTDTVLVGMDGFHFANIELARLDRADRKGAPDTFDIDGYVALLSRLRRQSVAPIYAPIFNRGIEEPIGSAIPIPGNVPLIITEGNYLLLEDHGWNAVRRTLDEVWFLDIDPALREHRLVLRRQQFGHTAADARNWVAKVDEKNAAITDTTRDRADLVVHLTTHLTESEHSLSPATPADGQTGERSGEPQLHHLPAQPPTKSKDL